MKKTLIVFSIAIGLAAGSVMALNSQQQQPGLMGVAALQHAGKVGASHTTYNTAVCLSTDTYNSNLPATAYACCSQESAGTTTYVWSPMTSTACPQGSEQSVSCDSASTVSNPSQPNISKLSSDCLFS